MDWLKLFALLVAVASVSIKADGPKKKIRIHLPQKVKHIHHHKKIYITNHPASSPYAPAYMPSAEGSVAVPTSVLPGINHLVPINDIYDEHQERVPNLSSAASHLLPLYHARGYYGPTHTEVEEQEYDLSPSEPTDNFAPSGFSAPAVVSSHPSKRVKIIKLNEPPRKKVVKKSKPKRLPGRRRPAPSAPLVEGEHPVSTFHEQFYSDVDGSATIRKVRKPPRVEKIIDGDTEHIHTYSEEHIHKLLYDGNSKVPNVVGVDPIAISAFARPASGYPFKGGQAIFAIPTNPFAGLAALGTMATPAHFEYAAYNPREVTHDHIFHDHGEIPSGIDITKEPMSLPPKVSYNGQGIRLSTLKNLAKAKAAKYKKSLKPVANDFSYYEGIYTDNRQKKLSRPPITSSGFEATGEESSYRSLPDLGFKKGNAKARNQLSSYYGKSANDFRIQPSSVSSPFSVSSTVVHDYKPNNFVNAGSAPGSASKFKDGFVNFKDNYANNFEYDTYASSSNLYTSEDKNDSGSLTLSPFKEKKKSISTQNMSFGGKDHVTYIDHLGNDPAIISDDTPTALDNLDLFDQTQSSNIVTPTALTYKSSSPIHDIVSYLNSKSIQDQPISLPEASNDNFQYAEPPHQSTTPFPTSVATTQTPPTSYMTHQSKDASENQLTESREGKNIREASKHSYNQNNNPTTVRGKLKYGDKL